MEDFKVSAVQMNALKDDLDHNLDVHVRFTEEAASAGSAVVLFPELSVTAHYGDPEAVKFAHEAKRGRTYSLMCDLARKHDIVIGYGFCEIAHGTHYNSMAFVGPKGMIGVQRKLHASCDEYLVFRMGRSLETLDFGFCTAGALICYDWSFSELWRILALRGVELVLQPNAGRCGGRGMGKEVSVEEQLERQRKKQAVGPTGLSLNASDNGLFAVSCGQVGYNGHSTHGGGAAIVDPFGEVLVRSEPTVEDTLISADLQAARLEEAHRKVNFILRSRRPELYGELTAMI